MPVVNLGDVELHYQTVGAGQDVVLIHGLGTNLAFWYWIAKRLSEADRRVMLYDLRGHGHSSMPGAGYTLRAMCEDLRRLLDDLGIERAHIVGHSFGARIALAFAGLHGERTRTLTVADTQVNALQAPVRLSEWKHWGSWKKVLQRDGLQPLPDDDAVIDFRLLANFNQRSAAAVTMGRHGAGKRLSMRSRDMGRRGGRSWNKLMENIKTKSELGDESPLAGDFFKSVASPTLLLYGSYSHCLATSEALLMQIPDCQRILIPGAGHFHPAIKPIVFTKLVTRFLNRKDRAERQQRAAAAQ